MQFHKQISHLCIAFIVVSSTLLPSFSKSVNAQLLLDKTFKAPFEPGRSKRGKVPHRVGKNGLRCTPEFNQGLLPSCHARYLVGPYIVGGIKSFYSIGQGRSITSIFLVNPGPISLEGFATESRKSTVVALPNLTPDMEFKAAIWGENGFKCDFNISQPQGNSPCVIPSKQSVHVVVMATRVAPEEGPYKGLQNVVRLTGQAASAKKDNGYAQYLADNQARLDELAARRARENEHRSNRTRYEILPGWTPGGNPFAR